MCDSVVSKQIPCYSTTVPAEHTHTQPFYGPFSGTTLVSWCQKRTRELLDFMVQGKINRGRHIDQPVWRHSIRAKQCPPPPSPIFYMPDALPAAQPTVSKHWRQYRQKYHHKILLMLLSYCSTRIMVLVGIATQ